MFIRLNPDGTVATAKQYDLGYIERLGDVAVMADGSCVLVGRYQDPSDHWGLVMRTDPDGLVLAASGQHFTGGTGLHDKVLATADGGLLVMGQHVAGNAFTDLHVMKFDSLYQVSWARRFTGAKLWPVDALQHADGGWTVLATEQVVDTIISGAPVLIPLATDGSVGPNKRLWAVPVGSSFQMATSMCAREDGGLAVCALANSIAGTAVFTLDSTGTVSPMALVIPDSTLGLRVNVRSMSDGQWLMHGEHFSTGAGSLEPLIARWDTMNVFPCGSGTAPVVADNITLGLDTVLEHIVPSPVVLDITALLVPDTIGWTVEDPCALGTSISESTAERSSLHAYPVPASEWLRVEGLEDAEELLLLNSRGDLVLRWAAPVPRSFQLPDLADGLYLLRAHAEGRILSTRIVIQH